MKVISWVSWILAISACLVDARYKIRRPMLPVGPAPAQMFKKSWPFGHRMSMGNTIHVNTKRPLKRPVFHKPLNFRGGQLPVFNTPPTTWKNSLSNLGGVSNVAVMPQQVPFREFHMINSVPEYSPEPLVMPPTHRSSVDDDRGPIHTIPAPNLSPADKPHNSADVDGYDAHEDNRRLSVHFPTNHGFETLISSIAQEKSVTNPTPIQNFYEATETNEVSPNDYQTVTSTYITPDDPTRLLLESSSPQSDELYPNHRPITRVSLTSANLRFPQTNVPIQTNLQSSLHVGFPGSSLGSSLSRIPDLLKQSSTADISQQAPDLHVGLPAPAGPPLSAAQLYDLLNSFPGTLPDEYLTSQHPQLQQHYQQRQLEQLFQPEMIETSFSQPQMHTFNYEEQDNKQQHQILVEQDSQSNLATLDNNSMQNQPLRVHSNGENYHKEGVRFSAKSSEEGENNIEYVGTEAASKSPANTFLTSSINNENLSSKVYSVLPNREAAEKLAALAAAGNVNSNLIEKLRKQHETQEHQQWNKHQTDKKFPPNHDIEYQVSKQVDAVSIDELNFSDHLRQQSLYSKQETENNQDIHEFRNHREGQGQIKKVPLRIMVPDIQDELLQTSASVQSSVEDYVYEITEPESTVSSISSEAKNQYPNSESDTRLNV